MASGKVLRQLIRAGAGGDLAAFKAASKSIIDEERQKQHHLLANDLEQILYGESKPIASNSLLRLPSNVPTDKERGLPLLDIRQSHRTLEELVLSKAGLVGHRGHTGGASSRGCPPIIRIAAFVQGSVFRSSRMRQDHGSRGNRM